MGLSRGFLLSSYLSVEWRGFAGGRDTGESAQVSEALEADGRLVEAGHSKG